MIENFATNRPNKSHFLLEKNTIVTIMCSSIIQTKVLGRLLRKRGVCEWHFCWTGPKGASKDRRWGPARVTDFCTMKPSIATTLLANLGVGLFLLQESTILEFLPASLHEHSFAASNHRGRLLVSGHWYTEAGVTAKNHRQKHGFESALLSRPLKPMQKNLGIG